MGALLNFTKRCEERQRETKRSEIEFVEITNRKNSENVITRKQDLEPLNGDTKFNMLCTFLCLSF